MGTAPAGSNEREWLQQQLLDEMQAAKQTYHSAIAKYMKAVDKAAKHERVARENYTLALKASYDLVVYGRRPLWSAKKDPSLRSLLHEPIFMMQAAQYGSLHNPVPDRQTVSVLVGGNLF